MMKLAGDAGEPGADGKRLHPPAPDDRGVEEADEAARVRLHRAAHVAEEHQTARAVGGFHVGAGNRFAPGPDGPADRPPEIRPTVVATAGAQPARPAHGAGQPQVVHQAARLGELVGAVVREVAVTQDLGPAVTHGERRRLERLAVVIAGVVVVVGIEGQDDLLHRRCRQRDLAHALPPARRTRGRRARRLRDRVPAWYARPSTPRPGSRSRPPPAPRQTRASRPPARRDRRRATGGRSRPRGGRTPGRRYRTRRGQALRSVAVRTSCSSPAAFVRS